MRFSWDLCTFTAPILVHLAQAYINLTNLNGQIFSTFWYFFLISIFSTFPNNYEHSPKRMSMCSTALFLALSFFSESSTSLLNETFRSLAISRNCLQSQVLKVPTYYHFYNNSFIISTLLQIRFNCNPANCMNILSAVPLSCLGVTFVHHSVFIVFDILRQLGFNASRFANHVTRLFHCRKTRQCFWIKRLKKPDFLLVSSLFLKLSVLPHDFLWFMRILIAPFPSSLCLQLFTLHHVELGAHW